MPLSPLGHRASPLFLHTHIIPTRTVGFCLVVYAILYLHKLPCAHSPIARLSSPRFILPRASDYPSKRRLPLKRAKAIDYARLHAPLSHSAPVEYAHTTCLFRHCIHRRTSRSAPPSSGAHAHHARCWGSCTNETLPTPHPHSFSSLAVLCWHSTRMG